MPLIYQSEKQHKCDTIKSRDKQFNRKKVTGTK